MPDHLVHLIDQKRGISIIGAETTKLCAEAETRHFCGRMASIALAKTLTGTTLISAGLKDGERQSVQINFNGKLRHVFAEANSEGKLRGYPSDAEIPELDNGPAGYVSALGSEGNITVIRWRDGHVPYTGSIVVKNPTIRNNFNEYLNNSEQLFAEVELVAQYKSNSISWAGGLLARLLPGGEVDDFEKLRQRFKSGEVFEALSREMSIDEALNEFWPTASLEEKRRRPISFSCFCSKDRVRGMLVALGKEEIENILKEEKTTEITCKFCNSNYEVTCEDLRQILEE